MYGYVDATFKEGMSKDECVNFCTNSELFNCRVITFNRVREGADVCVWLRRMCLLSISLLKA